ncbi:MAG: His/Gly/Thr/Pro-type tRNA ligase C-terminal domain-containing protein, partial [Candidatus Omnitrophota bacterium]
INEGEGAFYGPKIDIKLKDAMGRLWQCATIQCDFALPQRFDLNYISTDGKQKRPIMLHRVLLGSIERFIGALIEHYAGAFPVWLSPVQVQIVPVTENHHEYAKVLKKVFDAEEIRTGIDLRSEKVGYKIREAVVQKAPYILVIGQKEVDGCCISVRSERGEQKGKIVNDVKVEDFIKQVKEDVIYKK